MKMTWDGGVEMEWGSEIEIERKRRINVSLWAYAYERESDSLVSDAECLKITLEITLKNYFRIWRKLL
jgi:hypothetical protein